MKYGTKILFLFSFIFLSYCLFAQTDSLVEKDKNKINYGINISHITDFDLLFNGGLYIIPSFVLNKGKHSFLFGPQLFTEKYANNQISFFQGGMVSYQYFPSKEHKRINFYFIYDGLADYSKTEYSSVGVFTTAGNINNTYAYTDIYKTISWSNQVGYGFKLNIFKGVYFNQSASWGINFSKYYFKRDVPDEPSLSKEYNSGNIFSKINGIGFLKFGIGFDFPVK